MSVAVTLTLPAQPALGDVRLQPLGGDGYSAPKSVWFVRALAIAGDASGGTATITLNLDPLYESLVSIISMVATSAAGATAWSSTVDIGDENGVRIQQLVTSTTNTVVNGVGRISWTPPPVLNATQCLLQTTNVDATEVYSLSATIFNFNKRASEVTPLNILLASLPRGASLT